MNVALSTVVIVAVAASVVSLVAYGVFAAARRAKLARSGVIAMVVAGGFLSWLGFTATLARAGVFKFTPGNVSAEPLLPVSILVTFALLSRARLFGRVLDAVPLWQPVALQTFRVGVEIGFWLLLREGLAPVQVTFEGRNMDVLVGLTAPIVAILIARRLVGPRWLVVWNGLGVACLLNTIGTVLTSLPGPLHRHWPGEPFTAFGVWPIVWIPALFAPLGMFLHIVSVRQSLRVLDASVLFQPT